MFVAIVTQIIEILYSGLTGVASALGSGLSQIVQSLAITGTGTTGDPYQISVFLGMVVVFGAIGLAVGLTTFVVKWLASLGARN